MIGDLCDLCDLCDSPSLRTAAPACCGAHPPRHHQPATAGPQPSTTQHKDVSYKSFMIRVTHGQSCGIARGLQQCKAAKSTPNSSLGGGCSTWPHAGGMCCLVEATTHLSQWCECCCAALTAPPGAQLCRLWGVRVDAHLREQRGHSMSQHNTACRTGTMLVALPLRCSALFPTRRAKSSWRGHMNRTISQQPAQRTLLRVRPDREHPLKSLALTRVTCNPPEPQHSTPPQRVL